MVTAVGAKTRSKLLFVERANASGESTSPRTRWPRASPVCARSRGQAPRPTQVRLDLTCRSERMMRAVVDLAPENRNLPVQASLERYMKCGIGICDACSDRQPLVCLMARSSPPINSRP